MTYHKYNLTLRFWSSFFFFIFHLDLQEFDPTTTYLVSKLINQELLSVHDTEVWSEETRGEVVPRSNGCDYDVRRSAQPPSSRNAERKCGWNVPTFHVHTADRWTDVLSSPRPLPSDGDASNE